MPAIKESITGYQPMSYATDHETPADVLDCSLGINPYGCPQKAAQALKQISIGDIAAYPHGTGLRDALVEYWAPRAAVCGENIAIGNGSMSLLVNINRLFLQPGSKVYGIVPGFSAYTDDVYITGASYDRFQLTPGLSVQEIVTGFLAGLEEYKPNLICLENPNNPTGQALPRDAVEQIVARAEALGIPIIVDEAYGDYLPPDQSAVCLTPRYQGLIVTRTFSKGLGLAGLRIGYAVGNAEVAENLMKTGSLFDGNAPGRILARAALEDAAFIQETVDRVREDKARLLGVLKNLLVYPTAPTTPIVTLYSNRDIDLYAYLLTHGINAVPGVSFETVGKRGVRLILNKNIGELLRRLAAADAGLADC